MLVSKTLHSRLPSEWTVEALRRPFEAFTALSISHYGDLKIRREDFIIGPVRTLFKTIPELVP